MSQHDLSIANQGFPAFRSDLNDALQALGSMQSGTSAPATTYANMLWYDTTNNIVKMRNEDNDAWISLFTLDQSGDLVSAISAATGSFGALSATGNVTLGDSTSDTVTVNGATTFATQISAPNTFAFKNRIINGAMMIDQRNAGASVTLTNAGFTYPVDRFFAFRNTGTSGITAQRVSSGLTDLPNAIRVQRTNGDTSTTSNGFGQTIESNNSYDLAGSNITLSFRARCGANFSAASSQITARITTGTATDQGSNAGFQGTFTGQINTNTAVTLTTSWQTFTVTLAAPSNALEYQLLFYWANTGTAGAADYVDITGVQLEKGSTATSFDYRPYGTELQLCYRYTQPNKAATGKYNTGGATVAVPVALSPPMRTSSPSIIEKSLTNRVDDFWSATRSITSGTISVYNASGNDGVSVLLDTTTTGTVLGTAGLFANAFLFATEL